MCSDKKFAIAAFPVLWKAMTRHIARIRKHCRVDAIIEEERRHVIQLNGFLKKRNKGGLQIDAELYYDFQ